MIYVHNEGYYPSDFPQPEDAPKCFVVYQLQHFTDPEIEVAYFKKEEDAIEYCDWKNIALSANDPYHQPLVSGPVTAAVTPNTTDSGVTPDTP